MTKAQEAVKLMINLWDEVDPDWRKNNSPIQQKFLEVEAELKAEEVVQEVLDEMQKEIYDVLKIYHIVK